MMRKALGLDISHKTFDAALLIDGVIKTAKFENGIKGFQKLKDWLNTFNHSDIHICMEATGNYFEDVADYMGKDYKVSVINPLKISDYAKSRFSRTKTDKQDAKLIAEYCSTALPKDLPLRQPVSKAHYRLKRVLALQEQLIESQTAEKNRLSAAKDEFVKQIHHENIAHIKKQLSLVKDEMEKIMQNPELKDVSDGLLTIPSIGKLTAAILTNHLLSGTFKNAGQFVAFAGLSPHQRQSGTSVNAKCGITRLGNRRLRAALFMPAMVAYSRGYFPDFIDRLKQKKKKSKVIITAIMRKLAVIAFNLYKNKTTYQPERYQAV